MGSGRIRSALAAQVVPEERIELLWVVVEPEVPEDPEEPEELEEPEEPEELEDSVEEPEGESVGS